MHTGYNAKSISDLKRQYLSYISIDTDALTMAALKALPIRETISMIECNDFLVQSSPVKFKEYDD